MQKQKSVQKPRYAVIWHSGNACIGVPFTSQYAARDFARDEQRKNRNSRYSVYDLADGSHVRV